MFADQDAWCINNECLCNSKKNFQKFFNNIKWFTDGWLYYAHVLKYGTSFQLKYNLSITFTQVT